MKSGVRDSFGVEHLLQGLRRIWRSRPSKPVVKRPSDLHCLSNVVVIKGNTRISVALGHTIKVLFSNPFLCFVSLCPNFASFADIDWLNSLLNVKALLWNVEIV